MSTVPRPKFFNFLLPFANDKSDRYIPLMFKYLSQVILQILLGAIAVTTKPLALNRLEAHWEL